MDEAARNKRKSLRRKQILGATLRLLKRHGASISTAKIAAESQCSKETLYSWFDDREGIFAALAEAQAEGMSAALRKALVNSNELRFEDRLIAACVALLDIMTGEAHIAVNRAAMAGACREEAALGLAMLDDWQARIHSPMRDLIDEGLSGGTITYDDGDDALEVLIGLLIGDRQRRLLMGEDARPETASMHAHAAKAAHQWIRLHQN